MDRFSLCTYGNKQLPSARIYLHRRVSMPFTHQPTVFGSKSSIRGNSHLNRCSISIDRLPILKIQHCLTPSLYVSPYKYKDITKSRVRYARVTCDFGIWRWGWRWRQWARRGDGDGGIPTSRGRRCSSPPKSNTSVLPWSSPLVFVSCYVRSLRSVAG